MALPHGSSHQHGTIPGMKNRISLLFILLFLLPLSACAALQATPTATPATATVKTTNAPAPSPTVAVATATTAPLKVLLVAPEQPGDSLAQTARTLLADLATQAKLTLEMRPSIQPNELTGNIKIVIFLAQPANLTELLAAAPTTQFAVVTASDLAAKGHLSVVRANPEHLAFTAGFITTLMAGDWRSAGLVPDQPKTLLEAFQNGGRYWCGRCAPNFAPVVFFPVGASLPSSSSAPAWQAEFEKLKRNVIESVYIPAEVGTPALLEYMTQQKVILVGGNPPSEALKARWAVTIRQDVLAALKSLWPELVAAKGGKQVNAAITFSDINESLFSPGKQRLVLEVIQGLGDGTIAPLSVAP